MAVQQPSTTKGLRPFKPTQFGRYTLLMPLSVGGMGEIFLARLEGAQGFEKLCVIKKILPHLAEDADFVARFVNEARTLVKLTHGSIAQVLDMGLNQNEPYLAIEYIDGKDLRKVASRGRERNLPLPLTFVLFVMSRVLDALAYAHRKRDDDEKEIGLVHRDVSPQNILISYEGEVKVIDFGLAKSTLNSSKTNPSIILGKFLYMSPEQAKHGTVDRRSDLYAAGLCLYELISGKNPFEDIPPHQLMAAVANPSIPHVQQMEPLCPGNVAQLIMRALAPDPAQRFQNAEEFRGKLLACLLEIDAGAGPESASRFMRETFGAEYQAERKLLAQLKEAVPKPEVLAAAPGLLGSKALRIEKPLPGKPPAAGEEQTPGPTDLRKYGMEQTQTGKPPEAKPLSFSPTPKMGGTPLKPGLGERETRPGIVIDPVLRREMVPPEDDRSTAPHASLREAEALASVTLETPKQAMPAQHTGSTSPNADAMSGDDITSQVQFSTPPSDPDLPSIVVGEALNPISYPPPPKNVKPASKVPVLVPAASVRVPEIVSPLPKALEGRGRVDDTAVTDRGTPPRRRTHLLIVVMPLIAVLGLAALVGWNVVRGYETTEDEENDRNGGLKRSNTDDHRVRVLPKTVEVEDTEPVNADPENEPVDVDLEKGALPVPKEIAAPKKPKSAKPAGSPAEECVVKLRTTFEVVANRLEQHSANTYRMQIDGMEDTARKSLPAKEAKLLESCSALRDKIQTQAK